MTLLQRAEQALTRNELKSAEFLFKSVLDAYPNNGEALFGLGRIAFRLHKYAQAEHLLKKTVLRLPSMVEARFALADAYDAQQKPQQAEVILTDAVKLSGKNGEAYYRLVTHLLNYGDIEKAKAVCIEGIQIGDTPWQPYLYYQLMRFDNVQLSPQSLDEIEQLLAQTNSNGSKQLLHYTLAKHQLNQQEHKHAFNHLRNANRLAFNQLTKADPNIYALRVKAMKQVINDSNTSLLDLDYVSDRKDIFIVGMGKNGATLLEQMLCQSAQVGSLTDFSINNLLISALKESSAQNYPQALAHLNHSTIRYLRSLYEQELKRLGITQSIVINKYSDNLWHVALLKTLFPKALFIDLRRPFYHCAWSLYSHYFGYNNALLCSPDAMAHYFVGYEQIMSFYQQKYQTHILSIDYEELQQQPHTALEKVCGFIGIPYSADMLAFHQSKRLVNTHSPIKIRSPLNNETQPIPQVLANDFLSLFSGASKVKLSQSQLSLGTPET